MRGSSFFIRSTLGILFGLLTVLTVLSGALAADPAPTYLYNENPFGGSGTDYVSQPIAPPADTISTEQSVSVFLVRLINFALGFLGSISLLVLIWGGFLWISALGNESQSEKAKKLILFTIIGIIIILMSYAIVNTVLCRLTAFFPDTCLLWW